MTAAERLKQLSGLAGASAAVMLLAIGTGATAGEILASQSGLASATAAEHLLAEREQVAVEETHATGRGKAKIAGRKQQSITVTAETTPNGPKLTGKTFYTRYPAETEHNQLSKTAWNEDNAVKSEHSASLSAKKDAKAAEDAAEAAKQQQIENENLAMIAILLGELA